MIFCLEPIEPHRCFCNMSWRGSREVNHISQIPNITPPFPNQSLLQGVFFLRIPRFLQGFFLRIPRGSKVFVYSEIFEGFFASSEIFSSRYVLAKILALGWCDISSPWQKWFEELLCSKTIYPRIWFHSSHPISETPFKSSTWRRKIPHKRGLEPQTGKPHCLELCIDVKILIWFSTEIMNFRKKNVYFLQTLIF